MDYWDIKIKQDIVSASELVDLGVPLQSLQFTTLRGAPVVLPEVQPNGSLANATTPIGLIVAQEFPYVNATQSEVNGVDLDLSYRLGIGAFGRLSTSLNYSHMFHYYLTAPTGATYDLAGTHGPSGVSGDTGNPKDRAVLSESWDRGPWDATVTVNYVGPFNLTDPSIGLDTCGESIQNSGKWVNTYAGPASFCQVDRFVDTDFYLQYDVDRAHRLCTAPSSTCLTSHRRWTCRPTAVPATTPAAFFRPGCHRIRSFSIGFSYTL